MSVNQFYDDEASEDPASDASTAEEGEFLSDLEENEINSSDLSEDVDEEDEDEEEEDNEEDERDAEPRRSSTKKRARTNNTQRKHNRKRRHRYLGNEYSEEEDEEDTGKDRRSEGRRRSSSPRKVKERNYRRKRGSSKQKQRKPISKKHAVQVGRFEDDGYESEEISENEDPRGKSSKRRNRSKQATLPFYSVESTSPGRKRSSKSQKKKRESFDSQNSPRKSPSKATKKKKRRTIGPALQHLEERIEASGFTFKLFKGRVSPREPVDESSPTQAFKILINSRAHNIGVNKTILRQREVMINLKKPWVRYDAHAFSSQQIFNFMENLKLSNLISSEELEYVKMPKKKQEGSQPITKSFFLVIPHFRNEGEVILFLVPDNVVRLALLWHATKMLDLAIGTETEKAVAIGKKIFEMKTPFVYFNQKWESIKAALHQVSPEQEDLEAMLKIFTDIKGLSAPSSPIPGNDPKAPSVTPDTSSGPQHKKVEEKQSQDSIKSDSVAPAPTTPVLLDHPLLSTLIQKQDVLDNTLHKILGVLKETQQLFSEQSGTMAKSLMNSKTQLNDIERALDRSTPRTTYKTPSVQASPIASHEAHPSPRKPNGVTPTRVNKQAESKHAVHQEASVPAQAPVTQAPLAATTPSTQFPHKNQNSSPVKANYSSQRVSKLLESI